jgi:hypothetical protein
MADNISDQHRRQGGLMIELEIQGLSESRDGLLIDVGRSIVASGFTLQRQRLTQDVNGVLLTMVVRGPERKQRALEAALDANERLISFNTYPFEDGPPKPHYAAARKFVRPPVVAASEPVVETVAVAAQQAPPKQPFAVATAAAPSIAAKAAPVATQATAAVATAAPVRAPSVAAFFAEKPVLIMVEERPKPAEAPAVVAAPAPQEEPEPEFIFITPSAKAPAPAHVIANPFVEVIALGPDEEAVEKAVPKLLNGYPQIFHCLQSLESAVAPGARESSLWLAGKRTGAWVFERDYKPSPKLNLEEAMERIGIPALRALVEVEYTGGQLHIRNSPLCKEGGHSSCQFFVGYLEGLLGPVLASGGLSTFPLGCCSYGGDACVLAISE